jgi:hypothetical protein
METTRWLMILILPLLEIRIFRDVQDLLYQFESCRGTATGTRRKRRLFAQPDISRARATSVVWPPYAGNRDHFSAEKWNLAGFFG